MSNAGTGYLVAPTTGRGPGVLVLHSWWGLTPFFRETCDRLADEGFVALAPDLHGGRTADRPDEAEALLAAIDPNPTAALVLSSAATLRGLAVTPDAPIGVVGFSMGASWALWLSARAIDTVGAVVAFYGSQDIDFKGSQSAYLAAFRGARRVRGGRRDRVPRSDAPTGGPPRRVPSIPGHRALVLRVRPSACLRLGGRRARVAADDRLPTSPPRRLTSASGERRRRAAPAQRHPRRLRARRAPSALSSWRGRSCPSGLSPDRRCP